MVERGPKDNAAIRQPAPITTATGHPPLRPIAIRAVLASTCPSDEAYQPGRSPRMKAGDASHSRFA
jgi:hypothetical protein